MTPIVLWIAVMVVMFVVEAATVSFVSIWFAGGALAALITALFGGTLVIQSIVFTIVSAALLIGIWPLRNRLMRRGTIKTNADRVIGMYAIVTERIDNLAGTGAVRVDGKIWTARSAAGEALEPGEVVLVARMESVKLYVEKAPVAVG